MGCSKLTYNKGQADLEKSVVFLGGSLSKKRQPLKKCNEYYPFGLQANSSYSIADIFNNRLFNAGSELNESTKNYETFYRNYDPALGRFNGIDIKATSYSSTSPYVFANNDPVYYNDPMGDDYMPNMAAKRVTWLNEHGWATSFFGWDRGGGGGTGSSSYFDSDYYDTGNERRDYFLMRTIDFTDKYGIDDFEQYHDTMIATARPGTPEYAEIMESADWGSPAIFGSNYLDSEVVNGQLELNFLVNQNDRQDVLNSNARVTIPGRDASVKTYTISNGGSDGAMAAATTFAIGASLADGPLPIGDIIGLAALGATAGVLYLKDISEPFPGPWTTSRGQPKTLPQKTYKKSDVGNRFPNGNPNTSNWIRYILYAASLSEFSNKYLGLPTPNTTSIRNQSSKFWQDVKTKTSTGYNDFYNGINNGWRPGR